MIPVVDIFAGPGGLSEGFSAVRDDRGNSVFDVVFSIEKERFAHETLTLRAFFRQFEDRSVPVEYYQYLLGEMTRSDLFNLYPREAEAAVSKSWRAELGITDENEVDSRIRDAIGGSGNWVLIGGPPCQAYSVIGRSRYSRIWREDPNKRDEDIRHYLYREYLRIITVHRPSVFILENVRGLLSSVVSTGKIADRVFQDLENPQNAYGGSAYSDNRNKYRLFSFTHEPKTYNLFGEPEFSPEDFIIKCETYGIPQARHRVIILGIRNDIHIKPELLDKQSNAVNMEMVISDLPKIRSGISKGEDSNSEWLNIIRQLQHNGVLSDPVISDDVRVEINDQIRMLPDNLNRGGESIKTGRSHVPRSLRDWISDENLKGVVNHSARGHMPSDLHRYFFSICFASVNGYPPKLKDFPEALYPRHRNAIAGSGNIEFSDRFRVQVYGRPSTTITSHISKDGHYYIHPDPTQCRSLTVREAARLQTFPDNYYFIGPRTAQYHQVGNAVPPLLAYKLASKVYKLFQDITTERVEND